MVFLFTEVTTKTRKKPGTGKETDAAHLARACARIADEKKARDILILDLRGLTYVTDFFVIATAGNPRQLRAIGNAVAQETHQRSIRPIGIQGTEESGWVLHDYGDVVVHLFDPERRKLYDLELLWGDAPRIEWED